MEGAGPAHREFKPPPQVREVATPPAPFRTRTIALMVSGRGGGRGSRFHDLRRRPQAQNIPGPWGQVASSKGSASGSDLVYAWTRRADVEG